MTDGKVPQKETARSRLLNEAMKITHHDRNANYGNPEDNFRQIAELWTAYMKTRLQSRLRNVGETLYAPTSFYFDSADVAVMNVLIKVARLGNSPNHHDSALDIAGYAACLADIQESMQPKVAPDSYTGINLGEAAMQAYARKHGSGRLTDAQNSAGSSGQIIGENLRE